MKKGTCCFILIATIVFAFTVLPYGAKALPVGAGEYLNRWATGTLYVPYTAIATDKQAESESVALETSSHPHSSGDTDTGDVTEEASTEEQESIIPQGAIAVQAVNLSRLEADEAPRLLLINETEYTPNPERLALSDITIKKGAVLIMHTHGTEAYLPEGVGYYTEGEDFRSTDKSQNVVAVGEEFAQVLREGGITVYHDTTLYDESSFGSAYTASRNACKQWLADHPDISYVIDLHRDAVTDQSGKSQKPLCYVNGTPTAQVMLVIGTNEAGASHPYWENNLSVATKYQALLSAHPTFARPIYLRRASYNQQLATGAMLLEVGSGANSIDEAKAAARLAAECFVALYHSLG